VIAPEAGTTVKIDVDQDIAEIEEDGSDVLSVYCL
jgi:hypothetical protein